MVAGHRKKITLSGTHQTTGGEKEKAPCQSSNNQQRALVYSLSVGIFEKRHERLRCKAHGAQEPRHIGEYVEAPSTRNTADGCAAV